MAGLPIHRFTETDARRRKTEAQRTTVAPRGHTTVREAILAGVDIKVAHLDNPDSTRSYKSHSRLFIDFLEKNQLQLMPVDEIRRHHIMAFVDHRKIIDKVRNSTINNNIISLSSIFNELLDRGFVVDNPCGNVKKLQNEPKLRRPFTLEEAKAMLPFIYERDPLLMLAILLEFCCYMRPKEIRQMKGKHINLQKGIVIIPPSMGKTGKKIGGRMATIPTSFMAYFMELVPDCKSNNYIFGFGFKPDQSKHCSPNRTYRRHLRMLKLGLELELIDDATGLTYYSWKDSGITEALEYIPLVGVQGQAGHTKADMTLKYYKPPVINTHIQAMRNDVLPKKTAPPK